MKKKTQKGKTEMDEDLKTNELDVMHQTIEDCKILYCNAKLPAHKTCMCWLWDCGEGWHDELRKLSCKLEALNLLYYDKYKVRIRADQVKEKFGNLCFYYSIICDNYTQEGLKYKELIDGFEYKKDNGYFGIKHIVDEKGYTSEETDEDGNTVAVWHPAKLHVEITQHKEEYDELSKKAEEWCHILAANGRYELTAEQKVIIDMMDAEADRLIGEAKKACYNVCERCGRSIGTKYSPRCETTGWVTYICDECAEEIDKDGRCCTYFKNGALYEGKKLLKTKEQVDAEKAEYNRKMKEKYGDKPEYSEPDDEGEDQA